MFLVWSDGEKVTDTQQVHMIYSLLNKDKVTLCKPRSVSGGLDVAAEAVILSGLLLTSRWDSRSGTRGLDCLGGLKSPSSLQKKSTSKH